MKLIVLVLATLLLAPMVASSGQGNPDQMTTIVDEHDRVLLITGWEVVVSDQFLCPDSKLYQVYKVVGSKAHARYVQTLPPVEPITMQAADVEDAGDGPIVIYHTHTHESFVPTDGTDSIFGEGGIIQVGQRLADELEQQGADAEHIETPHCPADGRAYSRSRRTAVQAIREYDPAAIFDVHRDAAPARVYRKEVNGENVARILLVVGRYNPRRQQNTQFARQLQAEVNEEVPGLVKGIFFANGTYNQDLSPRALLLEIGSHLVTRTEAERGAEIFAKATARILQPDIEEQPESDQPLPAPFPGEPEPPAAERRRLITIEDMLAVIAVGGTAFTLLSHRPIKVRVEPTLVSARNRINDGLKNLYRRLKPYIKRASTALSSAFTPLVTSLASRLGPPLKRINRPFAVAADGIIRWYEANLEPTLTRLGATISDHWQKAIVSPTSAADRRISRWWNRQLIPTMLRTGMVISRFWYRSVVVSSARIEHRIKRWIVRAIEMIRNRTSR